MTYKVNARIFSVTCNCVRELNSYLSSKKMYNYEMWLTVLINWLYGHYNLITTHFHLRTN